MDRNIIINNNNGVESAEDHPAGQAAAVPPPPEAEPPTASASEPDRMKLLEDELGWAKDLKRAVEADPDIEPKLSDYDYCQIISCELDYLEGAIERARSLQQFRREYDLLGDSDLSVDAAVSAIRELQRLFPGYLLSFTFAMDTSATGMDRNRGHYAMAIDFTKLNAPLLARDEAAMRIWLRGTYYLLQATNPDFEATRAGLIGLIECHNFDWKQHLSPRLFQRIHVDFLQHFPILFHKLAHYHTGLFVHLLLSMGRPFAPETGPRAIEVGCTTPTGATLDQLFLQPTLEHANQRFLANFKEAFERRKRNVESFVLR